MTTGKGAGRGVQRDGVSGIAPAQAARGFDVCEAEKRRPQHVGVACGFEPSPGGQSWGVVGNPRHGPIKGQSGSWGLKK